MNNINERDADQIERQRVKRLRCIRIWRNVLRLIAQQIEQGGQFYLEQPTSCGSWRLDDRDTDNLVNSSFFCMRHQCMDGLVHPKSGLPMKKSTRIQSNDERFVVVFRISCDGHNGVPHDWLEGGDLTFQLAFYPK